MSIGTISTTESGVDLVVQWRIEQFFNLPEEAGDFYKSPLFFFGGETWDLWIFPNGSALGGSSGHVDLELCKCDSGLSIEQSFSLSLKTETGEKYNERHCTEDFDNLNDSHGFNRFITRLELSRRRSDLVPDGTLTIICTMKGSTSAGSDSHSASAECSHCEGTFNADSLSSHQKKCMRRSIKCPDCLEVVVLQTWLEEHECQQERLEGATATVECPHCKLTLEASSMPTHEKSCMDRPMKCPQCGEDIATKLWLDHKCLTTRTDDYNCREKLQTVVNIAVIIMAIVTGLGFAYSKLSPLQPPEEFLLPQPVLMVTDIGSTYLEIVWVLPEESTMNTEPARYTAHFRKYRDQWQEVSFPNASQTSYCLMNLDPGVPYQIYVVAVDSSGFSRPSETATIRTSKKAIAIEKLLHDMKEIMVSGEYSDITVSVRGEKFRLHKNILAARNPSLNSRFNNESQEPTPGALSIDDCDPDQFRTLIHYIYTGSADNLSPENVCGLYEVAVTYQEQQMKTECLEFMMNALSVDNFCDYTLLALKHEEKELFQKATELFMRKVKEIIYQVKWKKFLEKYPVHANELYIKAVDQNYKD